MAHRSAMAGLFGLGLALFVACSFDGRTLQVIAGPEAGAAGAMVTGSSGSVGTAGKPSNAGSSAGGGTTAGGDEAGGAAPGLSAGEKCSADGDCQSGPCLDGVCCASACAGVCVSCSAAVTGKADGACEKVEAGTDPHDDCAQGKDVCGLDGQCDGAGACRFAAPSTTCGTEACASNQYTPPAQCNGTGKCVAPMPVSCSGHPCIGTRCDIPCTSTPDCASGLFCDGTRCAPQKTDGTACTADEQCSNAHCSSDKVCCDKACNSKCSACLQVSTGMTDGKCSFVKAGSNHANDCPGAAKCNAGATGVTPAPACDGAGACATAPDVVCTNYLCNPATTSCRTMCGSSAECTSSAYCTAKVCKTKEIPGTLCTANEQCQSNACSGRCCKAGTPCSCPQPSAGNLIKNPGFDKDLASWTVDAGPATVSWQPGTYQSGNGAFADANACAYSGAAYMSNSDPNVNSQNIWQCVPIATNTDYDFGVQIATLSGAFVHCAADLYAGPSCTGGVTSEGSIDWINVGWSTGTFPITFNSSFNTTAKIYCYVEPGGSFFFDDIYLTPKPGLY